MGSQKIPLFDGVMKPVGDAAGAAEVSIFTPPDKNLRDGTQAYYEVHLWVMPEEIQVMGGDAIALFAIQDGAPASPFVIWQRSNTGLAFLPGLPVKMLDGYPVRGDVTIKGLFKSNTNSLNLYGYYYRVGQGEVIQSERRYIGQDLSPSFDAGLPILFVAGDKKVIHKFSKGRIDEISLAFQQLSIDAGDPLAHLRFEDASGVILPGTAPVPITVSPFYDYQRNPMSLYTFYQEPFGGNLPALAQLSVESPVALQPNFFVHGYFTRR